MSNLRVFFFACLLSLLGVGCVGESKPNEQRLKESFRSDASVTEPGNKEPEPLKCNGYASLCDRRFNEVVYAGSHNSMSSQEMKWFAPNHLYGMKRQLEAGVRAMMLDLYQWKGGEYLCHGDCQFGSRPLVEGFTILREFLDKHPNETLSLFFETYITDSKLAQAVKDSKLEKYVYAHPLGKPWPTLREMVTSGKRVLLFNKSGGTPSWLHKQDTYVWENHYAAKTADDLTCKRRRGDRTQPLYLLNHFLTSPIALKELAEKINFNPFFLERVQKCQKQEKQLPNFIMVDFYSVGDLLKVVNTLNGVSK